MRGDDDSGIFGAVAIIVGGVVAYFLRDRPEDIGSWPDGISPEEAKAQELSVNSREGEAESYTCRQAIHNRAFWILTYIGTATLFATSVVSTHVMPYLQNEGYARSMAGIVAMMFPIMSMFGRITVGWVSDFTRFRFVLLLTVIGQIIGIVLFYYAYLPATLAPFVILFGAGSGGLIVLRPILLRRYYGGRHLGALLGVCLWLTAAGGVGAPLLAGWIFDLTGSYQIAFWLCTALAIMAIILSWLLRPITRQA